MKEFEQLIKNLKIDNKVIVCAVSGGPDSLFLLNKFISIKDKRNITIVVAHINHHMRRQSIKEEEYIRHLCGKHNLICEISDYYPNNTKNFEACAREARYNFFLTLLDRYNSEYLFTAHHEDDLIETILMKLVRGSTISGYSGFKLISKRNNYYICRPLLYLDKQYILNYMKENKIKYFIDKSNKKDKYTRNRFRNKIIPLLKKENPVLGRAILEFSNRLDEINNYITKEARNKYSEVIEDNKINISKINSLDIAIKRKIIEIYLEEEYRNNIIEINKRHINKILEFCENKGNKEIHLPYNKTLLKEYNYLFFDKQVDIFQQNLILDRNLIFNNFNVYLDQLNILDSNYNIRLYSKELVLPLRIRNYQDTDYIELKNLGKKKVNEIFNEFKVSSLDRKIYPIITDSNDVILFIPGLKRSKYSRDKNDKYDIIIKCEKRRKSEKNKRQ